jgi:ABC-type spermidine/putrescine transport system permease subunit I
MVMALPPVVLVLVFTGIPICIAVTYTLGHLGGANSAISAIALHQVSSEGKWATFSVYGNVLSDPDFIQDLVITVWVTALSTALVVVLSWAIALYARFSESLPARLLSSLSVVPLFVPVVIASYAFLTFWGPGGFMKTVAHAFGIPNFPILSYSMSGVTLAEVWVNIPFGVLMLASGLRAVPDALIEAARDAGAGLGTTVLRVLLPLNLLPTVIAITFTGISVIGSFTVPFLVGPSAPNLLGPEATDTFSAFNEPQQAEVMAMVLFVLAILLAVPYLWANYRTNQRTESR